MRYNLRFIVIKIIFGVCSFVLPATLPAAQPKWCQADKPVKFAAATWDSAQFYTELARFVVAKGYDCKTEIVTGSKNITETALVSGDLEIWMEQWEGQNVITKKGAAAGKVKLVGSLLKGGTLEGWFVPEYVVKGDKARGIKVAAKDLKTIADLRRYKHLFTDLEVPSKGRFLNCPTGWECEKTNNQKLKAYGLGDDFVNFKPGTGGALDAEITSAIRRGKPVLFYYWSPSGILGRYKFYQLQEPAFNEKCWKTLFNTTTDDVCGSSSPSTNLAVGVSTPFAKEVPEIVDFLKKLQMPPELLNSIIAELGSSKTDVSVLVKRFLTENKKLWQSWVPSDVAANILKEL